MSNISLTGYKKILAVTTRTIAEHELSEQTKNEITLKTTQEAYDRIRKLNRDEELKEAQRKFSLRTFGL
jgi:hypothetical protein